MTITYPSLASSNLPDHKVLSRIFAVEKICLAIVAVVSGSIFGAWLLSDFGLVLHPALALMKANTALCILLSAIGLSLNQPKHHMYRSRLSHVCATLIIVFASSALLSHWRGQVSWVETLFAADSRAKMPGLICTQTAICLLMIGCILVFNNLKKLLFRYATDLLTASLILMILIMIAGYIFNATNLFGQSPTLRTAPHTLICLSLLGLSFAGRKAQSGFLSILAGVGIGSQRARRILPILFIMPFAVTSIAYHAFTAGWLAAPYAAALAATTISFTLIGFLLVQANRINYLEGDLRNLSLTDELTKIYNRRAFYLLGEHALHDAQRSASPLTVIFFDLDGLKMVNDTLGHEVGSTLLVNFANLLRFTFRQSDVIARLGGDEFAVVASVNDAELIPALQRLENATAQANREDGQPFSISYSVGSATLLANEHKTFSEIVDQADALMYERKRQKKLANKPKT